MCAQFRHCMCRAVAFELSVLAPITIPGMRTRCETLVAVSPRMEVCETEECRRSWCCGRSFPSLVSSALREGYRMRLVHVLRAASNYPPISQ